METALELKQYYRRGVAYNFNLVSTDFHRIFPFIWNTSFDHGPVQNLSLNRKECPHLLRNAPFRKLAGSLFSAIGSIGCFEFLSLGVKRNPTSPPFLSFSFTTPSPHVISRFPPSPYTSPLRLNSPL